MDIRGLINANNRTTTDISDEPLFWRKYANWPSIGTFLFKKIGHLHHFIGKSPRGE